MRPKRQGPKRIGTVSLSRHRGPGRHDRPTPRGTHTPCASTHTARPLVSIAALSCAIHMAALHHGLYQCISASSLMPSTGSTCCVAGLLAC